MKKSIISMLFVLLLALQVHADQYMLVMSKNDQVCQQMYELYLSDMGKHGKIVFENHAEYNWLKWDDDISVYYFSGTKESPMYDGWNSGKIAAFDINNDGKEEAVLFERLSLSGNLHDVLNFFPFEYYQKFKTKINTNEYPEGYPRFPPTSYTLNEFPVQMVTDSFGLKRESRLQLGAFSFVRPLKIDSQYFLSIFGSHWQGLPLPPLEHTNFISISQYNPDNKIEDICYFMRAYLWEQGSYPWLNKKERK